MARQRSDADGAPDGGTAGALRVLRLLTRPNLGGPARQAIALWHAERELGVATLLVTGIVGADETRLSPADGGVPAVGAHAVVPATTGWCEVSTLQRGVAPLRDRQAARDLRALVRAFRPHVVHTHTSKAGLLGRRAAWACGVPVTAHTFHGHVLRDYFVPPASWLVARVERALARRTDLLFAVSASCADELAAAGVAPRARITVVPPAVPLPALAERSDARRALGIGAGERRAVVIGRLVPIKRVADAVHAVAMAAGWSADIVGDGPERARIEALVASCAAGRVRLRGALPDIASLLPAYDALLLPSVREGCPLVAIEAFAAGVPVIGYDVPGVRDALTDHGRGVLVAPDEGPAGLGRALAALPADPAERERRAAAARHAVGACAPSAVAMTLVEAYRRALAGKVAPP